MAFVDVPVCAWLVVVVVARFKDESLHVLFQRLLALDRSSEEARHIEKFINAMAREIMGHQGRRDLHSNLWQ